MLFNLLATVVISHAQNFAAEAELNGHYEGTCGPNSAGIAEDTPVSLTIGPDGILLTHPMPPARSFTGEVIPGRVWTVRYPPALIDRSPAAEYCVTLRRSPQDRTPVASACFARDPENGRLAVSLKPLGGFACGELQLYKGNGTSAFRGLNPYLIALGAPIDTMHTLEHTILQTQRDAALFRPTAGQPEIGFNSLDALRDMQSEDLAHRQRAVEGAGRGFLARHPRDMTLRWNIIELATRDVAPEIRAFAHQQIALYVHSPLAVDAVLNELGHPSGREPLASAIDAARGLLEPINEWAAHRERLLARFGSTNLVRVYEVSRGFIDAPDLAAITNAELQTTVGTWALAHRTDLLDALVAVAANRSLPGYLREMASDAATASVVLPNVFEKYLIARTQSVLGSEIDRMVAARELERLYYNPDGFLDRLVKMARNRLLPKKTRDSARDILNTRARRRTDPTYRACNTALTQVIVE